MRDRSFNCRPSRLRTLIAISVANLLLFFCGFAFAGSFSVTPVRIFLDNKAKSTSFKIINDSEEDVSIQINTVEWRQDKDGADAYSGSEDVIVFPAMLKIDKGSERLVRVGYQAAFNPDAEKSYRLFLSEMPSNVSKAGDSHEVKILLHVSMPVFVGPANTAHRLESKEAVLKNRAVAILLRNSGNKHVVMSKLMAEGFDEAEAKVFSVEVSGWYILPGAERLYSIAVPEEGCSKAKTIKVDALVDYDTRHPLGKISVDAAGCVKTAD